MLARITTILVCIISLSAILARITTILVCIISLSCSGVYKPDWDYLPKKVVEEIKAEYVEAWDYNHVRFYVQGKVTYTRDSIQYKKTEYIATAYETWTSGKGDCEDIAILELAICNYLFSKKGKLLRGSSIDGIGHAVAKVEDYLFDDIYNVSETTSYGSIASLYITMNY